MKLKEFLENQEVQKLVQSWNYNNTCLSIKTGQCENYVIVLNKELNDHDETYYNLFHENPCGTTKFETLEDLFNSITKKENKGTYKANPSHWRY